MTAYAPAPRATVARGLAVAFILAAVLVGVGVVAQTEPSDDNARAVPVCGEPVEVREAVGRRVACADDIDLRACGVVQKGSLVDLQSSSCSVTPGGMSAAARLLYGLPIDLNRASAADLALLDGLGDKLAATIVSYREAHGAFGDVAELARVHGIGVKKLQSLQAFLYVDGGSHGVTGGSNGLP